MRALLDTHIWIWHLLGDSRLSDLHRQCIEDAATELWLSPVSVWEAHLLIERGRLPVAGSASRWIENALQALPVNQAPLSFSVAIRSRQMSLSHEDPADRFLAATAMELKLTFLTADERLLRCPDIDCTL